MTSTDPTLFTIRVRGLWAEDYLLSPWWRVTARTWYRSLRRAGRTRQEAKGIVASDLGSFARGDAKLG